MWGQREGTDDLGVVRGLREGLAALRVGLPALRVLCRDERPDVADGEDEVRLHSQRALSLRVPATPDMHACIM